MSVDPKDLMIGDWVASRKWMEMPFKLINVTTKKGDHFYGRTKEDSIVGPFFAESLEPIAITIEILEKNGFIRDVEDADYFSNSFCTLFAKKDGGFYCGVDNEKNNNNGRGDICS